MRAALLTRRRTPHRVGAAVEGIAPSHLARRRLSVHDTSCLMMSRAEKGLARAHHVGVTTSCCGGTVGAVKRAAALMTTQGTVNPVRRSCLQPAS